MGSPDRVGEAGGVTARLAVITSGFPRISETFALNELLALRRHGMLAAVLATKPGDWTRVQPQVAALRDVVTVLPDGDVDRQTDAVVDGPGRLWRHRPPRLLRPPAGGGGGGRVGPPRRAVRLHAPMPSTSARSIGTSWRDGPIAPVAS